MSTNLKILSLLFILLIIIIITIFVKKDKIAIKYSILWYLCCLVLILFVIFPQLLSWVTKLFGFEVGSNFIFACLIGILIVITISLTVIVSEQKEQIRKLIQEISILKSKK